MEIQFHRRRYPGNSWFCWATVVTATGDRLDLGDPWPASQWPKAVLNPHARHVLALWEANRAAGRGDVEAMERHRKEAREALAESVEAQRAIINRKRAAKALAAAGAATEDDAA